MTKNTHVPIQDAATVILLRDAPEGPEAFIMERSMTMAFSAGATVFPGGKVDSSDTVPDQLFREADMPYWQQTLGTTAEQAKRLLMAAIRETFEEVGVLFARPIHGGALVDPRNFEEERVRIEAGQLVFSDFLTQYQLAPDFTYLRPWSRWITPIGESRRYDTHFFLAAFPYGQEARLVTEEATSATWLRPQEALDLFGQGSTYLMPPTWAQFERLKGFRSVDEALAASPETAPIEPEAVLGSDPLRVQFPGAENYYLLSPQHNGSKSATNASS